MTNPCRKFSAEEKVKILRLHLLEKQPISDVCDKSGLNPNLFYRWSDKTGIKATKMIQWIGIHHGKYYDWASRYGKVNEHNAWISRDFRLAGWE